MLGSLTTYIHIDWNRPQVDLTLCDSSTPLVASPNPTCMTVGRKCRYLEMVVYSRIARFEHNWRVVRN